MARYKSIVLAKRPGSTIDPTQTFKLVTQSAPSTSSLQPDHVLIRTLYLSLDPVMRFWLNDSPDYTASVPVDGLMRGTVIGQVTASQSPDFAPGDLVTAESGWTEQAVTSVSSVRKVPLPTDRPVADAIALLGLTGLTAYFGLLELGRPKPGELIVVSGAAGATGNVVCQIALLKGARVVVVAGSEEKCQWLRNLECEAAVNYKSERVADDFAAATGGQIDIFYDNVGGKILDMAPVQAKVHARFVICGGVSQYQDFASASGPKNFLLVISKRIRIEGVIVQDFADKEEQARQDLLQWLLEGKLQSKTHIVEGGLESAPQALADLFAGVNTGKLVVKVGA